MTGQPARRNAWQRLCRSRSAWCGLLLCGGFVVAAAAAPWLAPWPPTELVGEKLLPPCARHPLGTDALGRDLASRLVFGSRLSLVAGLVSVSLALAAGTAAGTLAGLLGGWIDQAVMRAIDMVLAFPGILVALLVVVALSPGWTAVIVAVGLINVPLFARQMRAAVLTVRHQDYVLAARAAGAGTGYLACRVVFPALVSPAIVLGTLGLGTAILEVAGLSFLGVAGDISVPEWGNMLTAAKRSLGLSLWPALVPGAAISMTVVGLNLLGDGLRDALDPQLAGRAG